MRHGEVFNPSKILYGRIPGFKLSQLGEEMAEVVAKSLQNNDIKYVVASPLERAQQTATPIAVLHKLELATDHNLIESENVFEGQRVSVGDGVLRNPKTWPHLWNPFRPSWGEPYVEVAARMRLAIEDARKNAYGHEAVCVSHQLPIWIARLDAENRRFVHDPRNRQCSLASLTTFIFEEEKLVEVKYSEPAKDLVEKSSKGVGA